MPNYNFDNFIAKHTRNMTVYCCFLKEAVHQYTKDIDTQLWFEFAKLTLKISYNLYFVPFFHFFAIFL